MDFSSGLSNLQNLASRSQRENNPNNNSHENHLNSRWTGPLNNEKTSSTQMNDRNNSGTELVSGDIIPKRRRHTSNFHHGRRGGGGGGGRGGRNHRNFHHQNNHYSDIRDHRGRRNNHQNIEFAVKRKIESILSRKISSTILPSNNDEKSKDEKPTHHLCLLFITINDLPYEHIWRSWMEASATQDCDLKISVFCHAKEPENVKSEWLKQHLLEFSHRPKWGSIEITRAMIDLLHKAIRHSFSSASCSNINESNYKDEKLVEVSESSEICYPDRFLFLSESCLPIVSPNTFFNAIYSRNNDDCNEDKNISWINARNSPNNGYSRQLQFDNVSESIPFNNIWKADQWILLTRQMALSIENIQDDFYTDVGHPLWHCFKYCKASDEIYYPTVMFGLIGFHLKTSEEGKNETKESTEQKCNTKNNIKDSIQHDALKQRVTYCDWSGGAKNPVTFTDGIKEFQQIVLQGKEEGCLIARKFSNIQKNISVEDWKKAVL